MLTVGEQEMVKTLRWDPAAAIRVVEEMRVAGPWVKDREDLVIWVRAGWGDPWVASVLPMGEETWEWYACGQGGDEITLEAAQAAADRALESNGWVLAPQPNR